jgi:hypothetical protein
VPIAIGTSHAIAPDHCLNAQPNHIRNQRGNKC